MAIRVKVGKDRNIALPEEVIQQVGIAPGSTVLVDVRGGALLVLPEPTDASDRLRGLHRELWAGVDPDEYVQGEREECRD